MRMILAFFAGLELALLIAVILGAVLFGPNPRWDLRAKSGAETWATAWAMAAVVAFLLAMTLPLCYLAIKGIGKAWPSKIFLMGLLGGLCLGALVDMICAIAARG